MPVPSCSFSCISLSGGVPPLPPLSLAGVEDGLALSDDTACIAFPAGIRAETGDKLLTFGARLRGKTEVGGTDAEGEGFANSE